MSESNLVGELSGVRIRQSIHEHGEVYMESNGIIMFNRGEGCIVRAIVCLYTLRQYWSGNVTFYLEKPYPSEFDEVCKHFNVNIVHNEEKHEIKTLQRKTEMFSNPPYDRTMWLDSDTIVVGKIDEMFDELSSADICIPNFANWVSSGHHISKRIKGFRGLAEDKYIEKALKDFPAVNTGVLSFKKSEKWTEFVRSWLLLSQLGFDHHKFISDEISMQVLLPSIDEWNLIYKIMPSGFNTSVLHDHSKSKDIRVWHWHGKKHVLNHPNCNIWKSVFHEMCDQNIANINFFLKYADKRLAKYLKDKADPNYVNIVSNTTSDTTVVTAIDNHYLPILAQTFPNWRKYKNIDNHPVIVFINGMDLSDSKLDFLKLPNVRLIKWDETCMDKVDNHRELMLSAFVFGAADHVKTEYWVKLDADSYATDSKPLITAEMKNYSIFSHKWSYSRPEHIRKIDEWSKTCWHKKIKNSKPMIEDGRIEGNRFYHKSRRFISFVCFQKTRFTKYCVKLLSSRRLPCPSQDTFAYYCIQKLKPEAMGIGNIKKQNGFTQGKGKLGAEHIKKCIEEVDRLNAINNSSNINESSDEGKS